jgi:hypothetical protein
MGQMMPNSARRNTYKLQKNNKIMQVSKTVHSNNIGAAFHCTIIKIYNLLKEKKQVA